MDPPMWRSGSPLRRCYKPGHSLRAAAGSPGARLPVVVQRRQERGRRVDRAAGFEGQQVLVARDEGRALDDGQCEQVVVSRVRGADGWWRGRVFGGSARPPEQLDEALRVFGPDPSAQLRVRERAFELGEQERDVISSKRPSIQARSSSAGAPRGARSAEMSTLGSRTARRRPLTAPQPCAILTPWPRPPTAGPPAVSA